ncbi:hypothetical protein ABZ565_01255 [Streptomyces sp. NPDC016469]
MDGTWEQVLSVFLSAANEAADIGVGVVVFLAFAAVRRRCRRR